MSIPQEIWDEFFNPSLGIMDGEKLAEEVIKARADRETLRAELFAMIEAHTGTTVEFTQTGYWPPLMAERRKILTFLLQNSLVCLNEEGDVVFVAVLYPSETDEADEWLQKETAAIWKDPLKVQHIVAQRVKELEIEEENRLAQGEG